MTTFAMYAAVDVLVTVGVLVTCRIHPAFRSRLLGAFSKLLGNSTRSASSVEPEHDPEACGGEECSECGLRMQNEMFAEWNAQRKSSPKVAPEDEEECEHDFDADEGYHCLNCGKDGSEEVLSRAYDQAKASRYDD